MTCTKLSFLNYLSEFSQNNIKTQVEQIDIDNYSISRFTNEFWTAKQRQATAIHEISYRACFKAQLPHFFISFLTNEGDRVYDPFSGRGTTVIEAGLLNRAIAANDINPLSNILSRPRFFIPTMEQIENRLKTLTINETARADIDLSMFYHAQTEAEIVSLRNYLSERFNAGMEDFIDSWIRMVATNRLTGHSSGFFSVYTLPPNQAVSQERQIKINQQRGQVPKYRNIKEIILKKSKTLLNKITPEQTTALKKAGSTGIFLNEDASKTSGIKDESVQLTVTSPPFLDVVQYANDNWLRCWFNNIDTDAVAKRITMSRTITDWTCKMGNVFRELFRITRKGGWVAFEVGEVKKGTIKLEEHVVPLGITAGFSCEGILINKQVFTKTSNIWGVNNNSVGTNSNRIVIFNKA